MTDGVDVTDPGLSRGAPVIRFCDVSKSFGTQQVLDHLSFEVPTGQKLAIIGPSGSGKTTILRLLMTLEVPSSGHIEINGTPLGVRWKGTRLVPDSERHIREVRGQIGMVFQDFNLFPHMTALENVAEAPQRVLHLSRSAATERAQELLATVGLAHKASSYPRELSGGQQQRVAIARALAMQPRILLFDEVTSSLDPELVGEVLNVIRRLALEGGITMLIVTHEMGFARDVSDRVLFIDHGRSVEDASPGEIFSRPSNERTRAFLRAVLEH